MEKAEKWEEQGEEKEEEKGEKEEEEKKRGGVGEEVEVKDQWLLPCRSCCPVLYK